MRCVVLYCKTATDLEFRGGVAYVKFVKLSLPYQCALANYLFELYDDCHVACCVVL